MRDLLDRLGLPDEAADRLKSVVADYALPGTSQRADRTFHLGSDDDVTLDEPLEGPRYTRLQQLGAGGMGEVLLVNDRELQRRSAMKVLLPEIQDKPAEINRFLLEARTTAQLEHPSIIPVHELGRLEDGRWFFTMKEVRGRTLSEVIARVHQTGRGFRRLVGAFLRVCEAIAYAHERGVVHRDLKPDNVMVGEHGEVLVLDWGLARVTGQPLRQGVQPVQGPEDPALSRDGAVSGTPAYMPPEQARGENSHVGPVVDVYSLGAVLFEILYGRAPYVGRTGLSVLMKVMAAAPELPLTSGVSVPEGLEDLRAHAMHRDPAQRYEHAGQLAAEVASWLDGDRQRARALALVAQAAEMEPELQRARRHARQLREHAESLLKSVPEWAPWQDKAEAWGLQDEATTLEGRAEADELSIEGLLSAALSQVPELPEAHAAMAARLQKDHASAESRRDPVARRLEARLRRHAKAMPDGREHLAYLQGDGRLSLEVRPLGAELRLARFELKDRRLQAVPLRNLGRGPLRDVPLPMGSYLIYARAPGHPEVRYPVRIARQQHWQGKLVLPRALDERDRFVPGGPFLCGGDEGAGDGLPAEVVHVDDFVMQRDPVTNAEYLEFLHDVPLEQALNYAPRERAMSSEEQGALCYGVEDGHFFLQPDADGDAWEPDWPVFMVDRPSAEAFAAWRSERTGHAWRLPTEREWEKAARGVDGRVFPWGNAFDPSFCLMLKSHAERTLPGSVDAAPLDESPYGVRGLAGNTRDWCSDDHTGGRVVVRGGCWNGHALFSRACQRSAADPGIRLPNIGIRLVREG